MVNVKIWLFVFLLIASLGGAPISISQTPLTAIHESIKRDYQEVSHISPIEFSNMSAEQVVVFDVREFKEFDVSHIAGAVQISPRIQPEEFIQRFASLLEGKQVVFYCSVGRRSSGLASRLGDIPLEYGAIRSVNLTGGIFQWVNQGHELNSAVGGVTKKVHPYNRYWGRLIKDKSRISYTPLKP
jgi:rhodanese-related sulfurtransferase